MYHVPDGDDAAAPKVCKKKPDEEPGSDAQPEDDQIDNDDAGATAAANLQDINEVAWQNYNNNTNKKQDNSKKKNMTIIVAITVTITVTENITLTITITACQK